MKQKQVIGINKFRFKRFARKSYSAFSSLGKTVSIGVVLGTTLTGLCNTTSAQTSERIHTSQVKDLDEIVVSASLAESPLEEASKTVVVVSQKEIEQAPVQSINDLLLYLSNVDIIQRGGHGVQTDISIRGSSHDQVAILLNGINLSNAQTGHYNFDFPINTSDIEHIEILYGPSALLYGSSAFSGGINIVTKKEKSDKIFTQVEYGMHQFRSIQTRGAAKIGNTVNTLSVGYKETDGYIDNSDYNIYNLLWQTRLNLKRKNRIDFQLGCNDTKYGANTFYSAAYPEQYVETSSYMATLKGEFGEKLKFIPAIYWNRHHDRFDLIRNTTTGQNLHRNDTYGMRLLITYQSKIGTTSLIGEIRKDEIMSTKLGFPMVKPHRKYTVYDARTNTNVGLEHTVKINRFVMSAGCLMNHNSLESGDLHFSPSASIGYTPTHSLKLYSSWSKATRMPTFTDLHYTTETHLANETLRSERSESLELGAKYKKNFFSAYAVGFLSWGSNVIDWVKSSPEDEKWASWNHSKIDSKGVELGIKLDLYNLWTPFGKNSYFKVDYSHIYQDVDSKELISLYSLNYLKNKVTVNFQHNIYKGLSASWHLRFQDRNGSFIDYQNNPAGIKSNYPSYSTLDLKLNYEVKDLNIYANFNNLYNTYYYDLGNIPQAGFWFIAGINYKLKY